MHATDASGSGVSDGAIGSGEGENGSGEGESGSGDSVSGPGASIQQYTVVDSPSSWSAALAYCEARGGSLAKIESEVQNALLLRLLNGTGDAWVGGNDHE
eukprot:145574-Prymnesium_polylepis.1